MIKILLRFGSFLKKQYPAGETYLEKWMIFVKIEVKLVTVGVTVLLVRANTFWPTYVEG